MGLEKLAGPLEQVKEELNHSQQSTKAPESTENGTDLPLGDPRGHYKTDNYEANPNCEVCHGLGHIGYDLPVGHSDFGKIARCPGPGCLDESFQAWKSSDPYMRDKGISRPQQTFESYKKNLANQESFDAMHSLAMGTSTFFFLLLYGKVGNGKTHLANACAVEMNKRGVDCHYFAIADLISSLKRAMSDNTIEDKVQELKELHAVIFDDYKPEFSTGWENQRLEEIIDYRYRNYKFTVLITNRDLGEIPERMVSRFSEPIVSIMVLNTDYDHRRA